MKNIQILGYKFISQGTVLKYTGWCCVKNSSKIKVWASIDELFLTFLAVWSRYYITSWSTPPAMPHASNTGARPGALQGLNLVKSASLPLSAPWFTVLYFGSVNVGAIDSPGQWSKFGNLDPFPSQDLHPIVQPWENQKQLWPLLQISVPLVHLQL